MSVLLITFFLYIAGYFAHALYLGTTVYGDGIYYYAWLSLIPSKYAVGPAILWSPIYYLTHNQVAVGFVSVLATLFSFVLLYDMIATQSKKIVSNLVLVAISGATNIVFYGSLDTVNSHALSFFAVTVYLRLITTRNEWFATGLWLGIIGLMRPQDLVFGILLYPHLRSHGKAIGIGAILGFLPQLIAWQVTSGAFWKSPYFTHEGFQFFSPHLLGVLFNLHNGLFLWTPITLIGVIGLFIRKRYSYLFLFLLELFIVASWSTWWQGASYSGRMFVSSLPILAFGLSDIFTTLIRYRFNQLQLFITIVIPLVILNILSIIYFLLTT